MKRFADWYCYDIRIRRILHICRWEDGPARCWRGCRLCFCCFQYLKNSKQSWNCIQVRRQFRERPGILDNTEKPDYRCCVSIVTAAALGEPDFVNVCIFEVVGCAYFGSGMVTMLHFKCLRILGWYCIWQARWDDLLCWPSACPLWYVGLIVKSIIFVQTCCNLALFSVHPASLVTSTCLYLNTIFRFD